MAVRAWRPPVPKPRAEALAAARAPPAASEEAVAQEAAAAAEHAGVVAADEFADATPVAAVGGHEPETGLRDVWDREQGFNRRKENTERGVGFTALVIFEHPTVFLIVARFCPNIPRMAIWRLAEKIRGRERREAELQDELERLQTR